MADESKSTDQDAECSHCRGIVYDPNVDMDADAVRNMLDSMGTQCGIVGSGQHEWFTCPECGRDLTKP